MAEVNAMPYGRNSDRGNYNLLGIEKRGTCSSKHAFLKSKAEEMGLDEVELILCIFKMNVLNTPTLSKILKGHNLAYIPEAHCFLRIDSDNYDLTFPGSNSLKIEKDILISQHIEPHQIGNYKEKWHRGYLEYWLRFQKMNMSLEELWEIRENCIQQLSIA